MNNPLDDLRHDAHKLSLTQEEKEQTRIALQFVQSASQVKLDPAEKLAFRMQLVNHMHAPQASSFFTMFHSILFRVSAIAALALFVMAAGGAGLAYAAEQAQPGDLLYPVKINVTEPIIGTFKRTPKARAEWAVEQVQRRVAEALDMSERPLSETQDAELSRMLERYSHNADTMVSKVEKNDEKKQVKDQLDRAFTVEERRLEREMKVKPSARTLQTLWKIRKRSAVIDPSNANKESDEKFPVPSRRVQDQLVPSSVGMRVPSSEGSLLDHSGEEESEKLKVKSEE